MKNQQKTCEDYVELTVSSNLYSEPDKNNKQKLIKKDILTKLSVYIYDIEAHEEVFDQKGKLLKNSCRIHHKNIGTLVVNATYNDILSLKNKQHNPQSKFVGFNSKK